METSIAALTERIEALGRQRIRIVHANQEIGAARESLTSALMSASILGAGLLLHNMEAMSDTLSDRADEIEQHIDELRG